MKQYKVTRLFKQQVFQFITHAIDSKDNLERTKLIFQQMDVNNDGVLSLKELRAGYKKHINVVATDEEITAIFHHADSDSTGFLKWPEFVEIAMDHEKLVHRQNLKKAFEFFDLDGSGTIQTHEIKEILGRVNAELAVDGAVKKIFERIDVNKDGIIDFDEFCTFMLDINL